MSVIVSHSWSLKERFASSVGQIAWDRLGDGPPIVLVHGTPFSSVVWRRVVRALGDRFMFYIFDLLGYGASEKAEDVSLGVQNRVLAELFGQWGLRDPMVVAHDFGGAASLRAHLLNGLDYAGLLLIDPVAVRPWGSPFVQHVRHHEEAFVGLPAYAHEALVRAYIQTAAANPIGTDAMDLLAAPWLGSEGQRAFYRQIAQMDQRFTDDVQDRYGSIRTPVRLLWGTEDGWIPIARGEELRDMIPGAQLRPIPNAGHLVQEDAVEVIVAEIATMPSWAIRG